MKELWKSVAGYEGLYEVSNLGRVKSLPRFETIKKERIKSQKRSNKGYSVVALCKKSKESYYSVHRLVAEAFVANPNKDIQVNHIDGDKSNNRASNLEWVSANRNQWHSRHVLGTDSQIEKSPVRCIETGEIYDSQAEAARSSGAQQFKISDVARGKRKTAGGYHWEFVK